MTIGALIEALERRGALAAAPRLPEALAARRAAAITYDSGRVVPGSVFVGVRGEKTDGTAFAPQAPQSARWMSVSCIWHFSPRRSSTERIGFFLWPMSCQPFTAQMYRNRPRASHALRMSSRTTSSMM